MHIKVISVTWSYDPELNNMAANAGIIKVNVTFYRIINLDTAFERHGSRIPIHDEYSTGDKKAPCFVPWLQGIVA